MQINGHEETLTEFRHPFPILLVPQFLHNFIRRQPRDQIKDLERELKELTNENKGFGVI